MATTMAITILVTAFQSRNRAKDFTSPDALRPKVATFVSQDFGQRNSKVRLVHALMRTPMAAQRRLPIRLPYCEAAKGANRNRLAIAKPRRGAEVRGRGDTPKDHALRLRLCLLSARSSLSI